MTWCNENKNKKQAQMKHTAKQGNPGRHLKLRSWGVTTLHHYERISSRDLEWHRRDNGREREEVKLSCFFDKRVKPMNLERLAKLKERIPWRWTKWKHSVGQGTRNTARKKSLSDKIDIETTPVENRSKECERTNLGSSSIEKGSKTWWKEHNTPLNG